MNILSFGAVRFIVPLKDEAEFMDQLQTCVDGLCSVHGVGVDSFETQNKKKEEKVIITVQSLNPNKEEAAGEEFDIGINECYAAARKGREHYPYKHIENKKTSLKKLLHPYYEITLHPKDWAGC